MAKLEVYSRVLGVRDLEGLSQLFFSTLAETNRTYDFLVDWSKVYRNVETFRVEIGILSSLANTTDPIAQLRSILRRYPESAKVIPILVAMRERRFKILEDIGAASKYAEFDFDRPAYSDVEIEAILRLCNKTGIASLLTSLHTLRDYVLGVEVGLDTNARKNRSGSAMERIIAPLLSSLAATHNLTLVRQRKFSYLRERLGYDVPAGLENRQLDFALLGKTFRINVETNFYGGGGSKPEEIVDSYINRQKELGDSGWSFIWITDGEGWLAMANQFRKAISELDYPANAEFVARGLLTAIVQSLSQDPHA